MKNNQIIDDKVEYKSLEQVFNVKYYIDFYQRDYTWSRENVETLIDDLFHRFDIKYSEDLPITYTTIRDNYKGYYLNTYIINEQDFRICLVDGQQRFSTITLILIRLYWLSKKQELSESRIDSLKELICKTTSEGITFWMAGSDRIKTYEDIYRYEEKKDSTRKINFSDENLYDRYELIKDKVGKKLAISGENISHYLESFIVWFLTCVKLVEIKIKDSDDVAMVFEVINAKGQKLSSHDILKAQLLSKINKDELDDYLSTWEGFKNIHRLLRTKYKGIDDDIDSFFTYLFKSKYTLNLNEIKTFKDYHKTIFSRAWKERLKFEDVSFIKDFIKKDLIFFSSILSIIQNNSTEYNKEYKHLFYNGSKVNDITSNQIIIILSAIILNEREEIYVEKIKKISKLLDRNLSILKLHGAYESNSFNVSCNNITIMIRNVEDCNDIDKIFDDELINNLRDNKNNDALTERFNYNYFKNLRLSSGNKTFIKYVLARIEDLFNSETGIQTEKFETLLQGRKYNIEHILAKNEENLAVFKNEDYFNEQRERIGALLLIVDGDNKASSNEKYSNKLKTYENATILAKSLTENFYHNNTRMSNFKDKFSNIDIRYHSNFDESVLELRQKLIFEICKEIWK